MVQEEGKVPQIIEEGTSVRNESMSSESMSRSVRQFSQQKGSCKQPWQRAGLICMMLFEVPAGYQSPYSEKLCDKTTSKETGKFV